MSLRKRDSKIEDEISKFLDDYFYPNVTPDFKRYNSKEEQLQGIDCTFSLTETGVIKVDEKAATHYINKNLPTFAFELSFLLNSGQEVIGWLNDSAKKTEYYLLMWITAKKEWDILKDDITKIEAMLIKRKDIIHYLESESYTFEKLKRANDKIRRNDLSGALGKMQSSDVYFFSTKTLSEKPINIIIKKTRLKKLALNHYFINDKNVLDIK